MCHEGYQSSLAAAAAAVASASPLATDLERRLPGVARGGAARDVTLTGMEARSASVALDWLREGRRVIAATLVETVGSAPLEPGAEMLVDDTGRIEGWMSGGCVEGALVEEAHGIFAGAPPRVADVRHQRGTRPSASGLSAGGTVRVFVAELRGRPKGVLEVVREEVGPPAARSRWRRCSTARAAGAMDGGAPHDGVFGFAPRHPTLLDETSPATRAGSSTRRARRSAATARGERRWAPTCAVAIRAFSPPADGGLRRDRLSAAMAEWRARSATGSRSRCARSRSWRRRSPSRRDGRDPARSLPRRSALEPPRRRPRLHPRLEVRRAGADRGGRTGARIHRRARQPPGPRRTGSRACVPRAWTIRTRSHEPACGLDVGARTPAETVISILAEDLAVRAGRAGTAVREQTGRSTPEGEPVT